ALRSIGSVRGWVVADPARLKPEQRYRARLELRLDRGRLPKPFQINLFGGDWSTDTDHEWEFGA
ncbi:MAG: DUF4390 domain-containing protein, partial [Betaproteobacteria bacterium]|nr:DUF4390 domain-containing protein [Betaproteobacteria bacterium]